MGLFVGASFLSIVELIELIVGLVIKYKQKRDRSKKIIEKRYNKNDDCESSVDLSITKIST